MALIVIFRARAQKKLSDNDSSESEHDQVTATKNYKKSKKCERAPLPVPPAVHLVEDCSSAGKTVFDLKPI